MTPKLRARTLPDALTLDALRSLDAAALASFLVSRRWFAGRTGPRWDAESTAETIRPKVVDVVPLPWDDGAFAFARVDVEVRGSTRRYQLPLAARARTALEGRTPETAIATIESSTNGDELGVLFDAVEDQGFLRCLADAFAKGESHAAYGVRLVIEPTSAKRLLVPPSGTIALGTAEQSNTSIVFDSLAILKLFRRLEPGMHPDVEMGRFLTTRAGFPHTPVLLGELRFEEPAGERTIGGMLQEYVSGAQDAWAYALARVKPYFAAAESKGKRQKLGAGAGAPEEGSFLVESGRLGSITRELHTALVKDRDDPDFAPEPASESDVERWAHRVQQTVRDSLSLLESRLDDGGIPPERVPEARALVGRREDYLEWVNDVVDVVGDDAGMRIRVHGDYHLGQVLRTASDDFILIDFEGEPTRSLAERREKTSPLRDVAGMLRSFAYLAAVSATAVEHDVDLHTREVRAGRWERDVRASFLESYLEESATPGGAGILPRERKRTDALLSLFEAEKVFYELTYELDHRPEWVGIPLRGISKLLFRG